MFKAGILVLTKPIASKGVLDLINQACDVVKGGKLYIHLVKSLTSKENNIFPNSERVRRFIAQTYTASSASSMNVDVRVLLGNIGTNSEPQSLSTACEVLFTNSAVDLHSDIMTYARESFRSISDECIIYYVSTNHDDEKDLPINEIKTYDSVALGGTFDRIHYGHKILLSEALIRTVNILTIGITDENMNKSKVLCELISPIEERINSIKELVMDLKPNLKYNSPYGAWSIPLIVLFRQIVPISDAYGPTIVDRDIECLVVSKETLSGGSSVNDKRQQLGMKTLEIHHIELVKDNTHLPSEEEKISSSTARKRLLGTLLKKPQFTHDQSMRPYIIGLTGGIASGKSTICKKLEVLGAHIIDCDRIAHKTYLPGTSGYHKIVEEFGSEVVDETGEINRRALGTIVFKDENKLKCLNQIVWPDIANYAKNEIKQVYEEKGINIFILDAAVLIEADWQKFVHEVWTTIIPVDEAVKRIMERNKLSEKEATDRVGSQISNEERLRHAHVAFCSQWDYEYTQAQIDLAWDMLMSRMHFDV